MEKRVREREQWQYSTASLTHSGAAHSILDVITNAALPTQRQIKEWTDMPRCALLTRQMLFTLDLTQETAAVPGTESRPPKDCPSEPTGLHVSSSPQTQWGWGRF